MRSKSNNSCVPLQRMEIKFIEDCKQLMPAGFIFQQDGAPAHTARVRQEWRYANCPEIIEKDRWPPNSLDLNPLDYQGGMLIRYHKLQPKSKTIAELKAALQLIWEDLPQEPINNAAKDFTERLKAFVQVNGGHFEHLM